ncbi:MAG TPA: hypothetical protein VMD75_16635 [Candidatus Binataceae bacterium]|nr:hypothetical protein [Candidatus Binataceae bacterium]
MRPLTILFLGLLIGFLWFHFMPNHPETAQKQHQRVERLIRAFES